MPDHEELEQLVTERIDEHLDPWEISRLHEMEDARKYDPWEVNHEHEGEAPGMG